MSSEHHVPAEEEPVLDEPAASEGALDFVWQAFGNLNEWVRFSDSKAAAVLAADGVIVGALTTLLVGATTGHLHGLWGRTWILLIVLATFYSAVYALWSLLPQLKIRSPRSRTHSISAEESSSLVFFMDIDRQFPTSQEFHNSIVNALIEPDQAVKQISQQIWANSKVAAKKYKRVERALIALGVALFLGFSGAVLLALVPIFQGAFNGK